MVPENTLVSILASTVEVLVAWCNAKSRLSVPWLGATHDCTGKTTWNLVAAGVHLRRLDSARCPPPRPSHQASQCRLRNGESAQKHTEPEMASGVQ